MKIEDEDEELIRDEVVHSFEINPSYVEVKYIFKIKIF